MCVNFVLFISIEEIVQELPNMELKGSDSILKEKRISLSIESRI